MIRSLLSAAFAVLAGAALAQDGTVPPQLLGTQRPLNGDTIRFCIDASSVGAGFDRAVAKAIADVLLVKATFVQAPAGFPLDAGGYLDELQLTMSTECDALAGISLQPNMAFPEWASVTRAYADVPFVLVAADPSYHSLGDIPRDRIIGTAIGSIGEAVFLTYIAQLPANQQWRRLPYADPKLMLTRLRDGTLGGMILWQPVLSRLGDIGDVHTISSAPAPESSVLVGMLVSSRDQFLRGSIDEAIGALIADGTIATLMQQFGYAGEPAQ